MMSIWCIHFRPLSAPWILTNAELVKTESSLTHTIPACEKFGDVIHCHVMGKNIPKLNVIHSTYAHDNTEYRLYIVS